MASSFNEPIAIIGTACRFAGDATSASKLWELLREPRDIRREVLGERFSAEGFFHPNGAHHGRSNVRHAYMINEDVALFDAEFFGIKPVEAKSIDPQQRLLLETVYEGLEHAGLVLSSLRGTDTSVYVGVMCNDYEDMLLRELQHVPTYLATGIGRSILSNRISYFFDWHGPSITLDTACSSSLVAVHMAVQTLRSGESRIAVACGSNLLLGPENFIVESKLKMLSPDGQSKMWDRDANGYARGDGVGVVVMKTLSHAIADGDNIDCVIRETCLNQDGATTGITMPNSAAQKHLIMRTYEKAGLNLETEEDRPQFFEAHGTGTPAGDPIEAEAIAKAFFGDQMQPRLGSDPLYVGSIKTVLGHTEGTAGIAAVLKAALALKNSIIPPNLLFSNLSEKVKPFYQNLKIPLEASPWPVLRGGPRRVSVNSFGFGGANAHAILESYDRPAETCASAPNDLIMTPFVLSARSEISLRKSLSAYLDFLSFHEDVDIHDLAYTLRHRRTVLSHRISITSSSAKELRHDMAALLSNESGEIGIRALSKRSAPKILGIFTGQGAQYARMGAELIERSGKARSIIRNLESHLKALPDPPTWSLQAELLASADKSRVAEAAISQPLCTAVQILLLNLLAEANIKLHAVIGHSSGEIAAAHAAGFLSARDAMVVAYYRGLHTKLSASPTGTKGAMLAIGTSLEDAQILCEDQEFVGRVNVAACNSSSSITISGDEGAIDALQIVLEDEKKFARKLRVDQAYHSKHMLPAFEPYRASVEAAEVKVLVPADGAAGCLWVSSVYDEAVDRQSRSYGELRSIYWAQNMTQPVLFSQAMRTVLTSVSDIDLAIELGPHAALTGPATQTMQEVLQRDVPYSGALTRGVDAVVSVARTLGFMWNRVDAVELDRYEREVNNRGARKPSVVKDLPSYSWTHEVRHWHESRRSRKIRTRQGQFHSLLGDVSPDSAPHCFEWRNVLRRTELPWLDGHRVQMQMVFPAAGCAATALEAARFLAQGKTIRLLELIDLDIRQAVTFSDEEAGIEVIIRATISDKSTSDCIRAQFTYLADLGSGELMLAATGMLVVVLGDLSADILPCRASIPPHTIAVETTRFYNSLTDLGYNFSGRFQSLSELRRKHGFATCLVNLEAHGTEEGDTLFIHPAELDASFQSIILAYAYPYDDQLRMMHLPTSISRISVNPALCGWRKCDESAFIDAWLQADEAKQGFTGSCTIYASHETAASIRVEGVNLKPLGSTTADSDRKVFSEMCWYPDVPSVEDASMDTAVTEEDKAVLRMLERMSTYYLREFDKQVPENSPARHERHNSCYLDYAKHMTAMVARGENPWVDETWQQDTIEDVRRATDPYEDLIPDVKIMHLVGQQMPRVFRGETNMLNEFRESGLLDDYYTKGFGFKQVCKWLSRVLVQISDRYPHMNILEIGAGTGGATKSILPALNRNFLTYTFTDVSAGFFESAAVFFADYKEHMAFKVFDLEQDPVEQGYAPGFYDIVVGSLVVHATAELEKTLKNIRKLLRPGGFLVIGEGSHNCTTGGFIFGPLAGWWLGVDEGRTLTPFVSTDEWTHLLKKTGFSGIDTITPKTQEDVYGVNVWVAQAVDEEIRFLRDPLSPSPDTRQIDKLVIVGGKTSKTKTIVSDLERILSPHAAKIHKFQTLADVDYSLADSKSTVLSLVDMDGSVLDDIQPDTWHNLKQMFEVGKCLLWLTSGREADDPYANMMVGFGRTAMLETPGLRLQFLDVPNAAQLSPRKVAETLVRFQSDIPERRSDILWSVESEILMNQAGRLNVARLREISEPNDRYNSAFRPIQHEVNIGKSAVLLQYDPARGFVLKERSPYDPAMASRPQNIELRLTHSLLYASKTSTGFKFVVIGEDQNGKQSHMALVSALTSKVSVSPADVVPLDQAAIPEATALSLAAAYLTATAICDPLAAGDMVAVHNAPDHVTRAINARSLEKEISVTYTADLEISAYLSKREARRLIPGCVCAFAGFSETESGNEATMAEALPDNVRKDTVHTMYALEASLTVARSNHASRELLQKALHYAQTEIPAASTVPITRVTLEDVTGHFVSSFSRLTVVDWTTAREISADISRLDSTRMFKGNKTYWMVGLSGVLGLSLCDWMIARGARFLVLTSRNPKISSEWVRGHGSNGVKVTILPCDITDEAHLRSVYQVICDTLPPIIGVLNGAMVLRDVSILNMSFDQLVTVTRPKVLGSIYLDRIFDHQALDFFIFFSSINCVVGNLGQANYAAANMFMCAMAANRRKRGLTASAINVGAIIGAGYMERESSKALDLTVSKMALMHLSEEDFHQLFAEGIEAGRNNARHGPEISTGLLHIDATAEERPRWCKDPKFLHFIKYGTKSTDANPGQTATATISDMLKACKTKAELLTIIQNTFAAQLRNVLQLTTGNEDLMSMRSNEIGLDSLISVDVRAWFLKYYHVSIPVLKIMGNDTMANLAEHVVEAIPAEVVPEMIGGQSLGEDTASSEASTPPKSADFTPDRQSSSAGSTAEQIEDFGTVDYETESTPPADFADLAFRDEVLTASVARTKPETILLTGASGLLGRHLLDHLLDSQPQVKKVICIAVRSLSSRSRNLRHDNRVSYYKGDLSAPRLGLSEEDAVAISNQIDAVIHNGADTSHLKFYRDIKAANVLSTRYLVRMCLPRRIPIHYVSSVGVSLFRQGRASFSPVSATDVNPPDDGSHGYIASKWTNERFLERVSKQYGLKSWVHRPSTIIRQGNDTIGRAAELDWVNALVDYSHRMKTVPKCEYAKGSLDFVYVESTVRDIVRHVVENESEDPVTYVHQVGEMVIPLTDLKTLAGTSEKLYSEVSMTQWAAKAIAAGLHPAVAALIETMDSPGVIYPQMIRGN